MRILPVLIMIAAGACVSIQGPINLRLRTAVESPVMSAAISFLSGGLILCLIMATGALGGNGTGWKGLQIAPWWAYLGGAMGVTFVLGSIFAIPEVGSLVVIGAAICGQLIASALIDTFGWFGLPAVTLSPGRLLGICLLVAGVFLIQRK
jgi:bacterial/archaeal transporter family-2 protein